MNKIIEKLNLELSIILPIYNVEPYLVKCIRSLEDQDIPKETYEIICVNDGSPDSCLKIIKKLQKEYSNIVLIDQKNQGVSVARNNGIKKARGKYLMFVDPDDALQVNCLKGILKYAEDEQLDIVYSPFIFVEMDDSFKKSFYYNYIGDVIDGVNLYFAVRGRKVIDPDRSVAIFYIKKLIIENQLFFLKDVPYLEDGEFIARVLCLAKRTAIYNNPYYLRLNRPGSATRSDLFNQKKTIEGFILAAKNLRTFKEDHSLNEQQKGLINGRIVKFIVLAISATLDKKNNFKWVKNELKESDFLKLDLSGFEGRYYKLGLKYNFSIDYLYFSSKIGNLKKSIQIRLGKA